MGRMGMPIGAFAFALVLSTMMMTDVRADRLYQWVNPATGLPQLSGAPPSWYRSPQGGPRVLVFDNGALIDDTALRIRDELALRMRDEAFAQNDDRRKQIAARLEETRKREVEKLERAARPKKPRRSPVTTEEANEDDEPALGALEQFGSDTIEKLKSIISEFDRSETNKGE